MRKCQSKWYFVFCSPLVLFSGQFWQTFYFKLLRKRCTEKDSKDFCKMSPTIFSVFATMSSFHYPSISSSRKSQKKSLLSLLSIWCSQRPAGWVPNILKLFTTRKLLSPPVVTQLLLTDDRHVHCAVTLSHSVLLALSRFTRSHRHTQFCDPAKPGLSHLEVDDDSRQRHVEPLLFLCGFEQQAMLLK